MTEELKTLKDLIHPETEEQHKTLSIKELKQEAIKWYREKRVLTSMDWERFFNITEADLEEEDE